MPTLDAPNFWRSAPPSDSANTDWPILATSVLYADASEPIEHPTTSLSFDLTAASPIESDAIRVRLAVRRAVEEFGPAFDRLGAG